MTEFQGVVPTEDWICLEYPAFVENESEVLRTLEGGEAVARAESSGQNLVPVILQPDNPHAHCLYAARTESQGLVITFKKHTSFDGTVKIGTEVIAKISASYRFSGMNDFVFTPNGLPIEDQFMGSSDEGGAGGETRELGRLVSEDPRFSQVPILNIPPLFSKLDCPVESILKEKSSASVQQTKGYGQSTRYAIPFSSPKVPQERDSAASWKERYPESWNELEDLFKRRPIWSEEMLMLYLVDEMPKEAFFNLIGAKCYRFRDGPWQKLWIIRGLDPRLDITTRKFQAFIYSLPSNWYVKSVRSGLFAKLRNRVESTSIQELNKFQVTPLTKNTLFQCCDCEDDKIQQILNDVQNCKDQCSPTTGWFTNEAWSEIHNIIQTRFHVVLESESAAAGNPEEKPGGQEAFPAEQLLSYLTDLPPMNEVSQSEEEEEEEESIEQS